MERRRVLRTALRLGLMTLLAMGGSPAWAMRCDGRLVTVGDRRFEVLAACGEPDLRLPVQVEVIGTYALLPYEELWYYNFGPNRFLHQLRFRQGRLTAIETPGYGFAPEAPGPCRPEDLRRGMTHLELVVRCGQPADREQRIRWLPWSPGFPAAHGRMVLEEEWIYDFGPRRFYRFLIIIDGMVVEVGTGRRGN